MELLADRDPEEARKLLDPVIERMMEESPRLGCGRQAALGDIKPFFLGRRRSPMSHRGPLPLGTAQTTGPVKGSAGNIGTLRQRSPPCWPPSP